MKHIKRVLSLLLALALVMGLAVQAGALDIAPPVLGYPEIKESTSILFIRRMPSYISARIGETVTLSPEARLPAGKIGTLRYQWYASDGNDYPAKEPYCS